jgi:hypothetical protein
MIGFGKNPNSTLKKGTITWLKSPENTRKQVKNKPA